MKKKLLIIIDTVKPLIDGVSTHLNETVGYLSKKYIVTIIAPDYGEASYPNVKLIQYPVLKHCLGEYGFPKINRKILRREVKNSDIILNRESIIPFYPSFFALKYAKKYKKPFFTYVHSLDWELSTEIISLPNFIKKFGRVFLKTYARWFLNNNTIVLVSLPTVEDILRKNKINAKIEKNPVGVPNIFKPGKSNFSLKGKIIISFVGRISREKGVHALYETFLNLNSKFNNIFLLLIGAGPDRNNFNDNENIKITGFVKQKEVVEYLRATDIFVLPSVTETSSLSTMEAMKTGVCCVVRNVGAIKDYLEHGYNGYFFDNIEELKEILEMLIKNEELRKKIGKKAHESMLKYTWENTANVLIKILENNS